MIDYWRKPPSKDISGWHGPFIIKNTPEQGKLGVRIHGNDVNIQYPDARLTLFAEVVMLSTLGNITIPEF